MSCKSILTRIKEIEKEIEDIELFDFENKKVKYKQNLVKELDTLYAYKSKGAKVRARAHWIDEGGKKYFILSKIRKSMSFAQCNK